MINILYEIHLQFNKYKQKTTITNCFLDLKINIKLTFCFNIKTCCVSRKEHLHIKNDKRT